MTASDWDVFWCITTASCLYYLGLISMFLVCSKPARKLSSGSSADDEDEEDAVGGTQRK